MGRATLGVVRDGLGDPRGGPGRVWIPFGSFWTGWATLLEVRNGSRHPLGGPGRVGTPSGRSGTPFLRSGAGRDTF